MSEIFKIKFKALIPMEGEVVENGELLIEEGRIKGVFSEPTAASNIECLDLSDHLLLPGFVNAHCHLSLSALHGKVPRCDNFTDWVRALLKENMQLPWGERVRALKTGALEMLNSGVTTLADTMSQPELLTEYAALSFRQILFLEVLGFKKSMVQEALNHVTAIFKSQNIKGDMLRLGLAPHAPYSVSPELFRELKKLASQYDCPTSCHVAEFPEEVRFLKEGGGELQKFLREREVIDDDWQPPGISPVRYLDGIGVLDEMTAVHLNHIDGDIELLVAQKASAVFCPGSTHWFGRMQFMPVPTTVRCRGDGGVGNGFFGEQRIA